MMKKLDKKLLLKMITESYNYKNFGYVGTINEPVAGDSTDTVLVDYEDKTQRIVELLEDIGESIGNGLKNGSISAMQGEKISDTQLSRIQRALDYVNSQIEALNGDDDLEMTKPEV